VTVGLGIGAAACSRHDRGKAGGSGGSAAAPVATESIERPAAVVAIAAPAEGRDPALAAETIARPIEDAVAGQADVVHVATTIDGDAILVVALRRTDGAPLQLGDPLARKLPPDVDPPTVRSVRSGATFQVSLRSDQMPAATLRRTAEALAARLESRFPGPAAVCGGDAEEVDVVLDPSRLAAYGLDAGDVVAALAGASVALPAGRIAAGGTTATVRVTGPMTIDTMGTIVVATPGGVPVRIADLARIEDRPVPAPCDPPAPAGTVVLTVGAAPGTDRPAVEAAVHEVARDLPVATEIRAAPAYYDVALAGGADGAAAIALGARWRAALASAPDVMWLAPVPAPDDEWVVEHDAAATLGVETSRIRTAIEAITGGVDAGTLDAGGRSLTARVRIPLASPDELAHVHVRGARGLVPFSQLVHRVRADAPIARFDRAPAVILRFAVPPGADADARADAAIARARTAAPPPAGVRVTAWREP